jgi:alkaline phosphatase D
VTPRRNRPFVVLVAGLLIAVAGGTGVRAARAPQPGVEFVWSGAVTPTSVRITARVRPDGAKVHILVSDSSSFDNAKRSDELIADSVGNGRTVSATFDGLTPATEYHYAVSVNGDVDGRKRGRFRTFPEGPHSFKIAFGSCAKTGSESLVFDTIRAHQPDLFMHLGDFHYENIDQDNPEAFRRTYGRVLSSRTQADLYRAVPIVYVWDDHDFGPNDTDRTNPARRAAHKVYRETVPHYPLQGDDAPIYQAFTIGRARVIVSDTRSARDPYRQPRASLLGAQQKAWLEEQLTDAAGKYPLVIWAQSVPWIAETGKTADGWAPYCLERREMAKLIDSLGLTDRMVMLSGDAHMLALDDGRHTNYATDGCAFSTTAKGFPVLQAAAFDRRGTVKGGPYAPGLPRPGRGHFGLVEVRDEGGDTIRVRLSGRDIGNRELMGIDVDVAVPVRSQQP